MTTLPTSNPSFDPVSIGLSIASKLFGGTEDDIPKDPRLRAAEQVARSNLGLPRGLDRLRRDPRFRAEVNRILLASGGPVEPRSSRSLISRLSGVPDGTGSNNTVQTQLFQTLAPAAGAAAGAISREIAKQGIKKAAARGGIGAAVGTAIFSGSEILDRAIDFGRDIFRDTPFDPATSSRTVVKGGRSDVDTFPVDPGNLPGPPAPPRVFQEFPPAPNQDILIQRQLEKDRAILRGKPWPGVGAQPSAFERIVEAGLRSLPKLVQQKAARPARVDLSQFAAPLGADDFFPTAVPPPAPVAPQLVPAFQTPTRLDFSPRFSEPMAQPMSQPKPKVRNRRCEVVKRRRRRKGQCREGFFKELPQGTRYTTWRVSDCKTGKTIASKKSAKRAAQKIINQLGM